MRKWGDPRKISDLVKKLHFEFVHGVKMKADEDHEEIQRLVQELGKKTKPVKW
jgi:hypothetical protein